MRVGARRGNRLHAPENSRAALLSAYTSGAQVLQFEVQVTADGHPVVAAADDTGPATGVPGRISAMSLHEVRALDFSPAFRPPGSPGFRYRAPGRAPVRVEPLADLLDVLPDDVTLLVEVGTPGIAPVLAALAGSGRHDRTVLCSADPDCLRRVRQADPQRRTVLRVAQVGPDLAGLLADARADGFWASTGALPDPAVLDRTGGLRVGAVLSPDRDPAVFTAQEYAALRHLDTVWALLTDSMPAVAPLVRPGRPVVETDFAGKTVDTRRFAFGYARANRFCDVFCDDGVHVRISPYDGAAPPQPADPVSRRLAELTEAVWAAARDWPFYSGGGFALVPGVDGDFVAEVEFSADVAAQATMCELAATNVDPGRHLDRPPQTFRDWDSCFDPHGAPPFVGSEHDEDDGYRINWNLGHGYENNRYGPPCGDGTVRSGRLRLERRGPWFAAYWRNSADATDWVCTGAVRNDSLNPTVHLRCAGKRWRQERADPPGGWYPIPANEFVFHQFAVRRFP